MIGGLKGRMGQRGIRGEKGERGLPGRCSSQALESVTMTSPTSSEDMKGAREVLNQLFGACVEDLLAETGNQMTTCKHNVFCFNSIAIIVYNACTMQSL